MNILYARGCDTNRNVLRFAYDTQTHHLQVAETGNEAYRFFLEKTPDIMVLDIDLADIDVPRLIKTIRQINKSDIPILLLLQPEQIEKLEPAMRSGANCFLMTPVSEATFRRTIGMQFN